MKVTRYEIVRLINIWRQAYDEKKRVAVSEPWQANVMRAVRHIGPLHPKPQPFMLFGQFAWRLSPVTVLLIIVSTAILLSFNFTPEHNLLVSLITDAEEFTISQLLPL